MLLRVFALVLMVVPGVALAQQVAFGGIRANTSAPVEITADSLSVRQEDGTAIFSGNVLILQEDMRLQAASVQVEYGDDHGQIKRLHASGGVTLVSAADSAEAREAVYEPASGQIVMTGDVLLTQGANVMAGQKLVVDLKTGTGQMDGRVRTILQPGGN
ncbi:MAG: lipopolysaccharide transport periplasmic protein LptA [Paracoccaceae bacterium]|nr:lipopolysaccharide transport periplasmic protein LptA [Paracoccaceae bacterium]